MKKILVIILIILVIVFLLIFNIVKKGNENTVEVFNKLNDNLSLNYDKINNISYYYGNNTYFVVEFEVNNVEWYAIIDENEKVIDEIKINDLYDEKNIKKKFTNNYEMVFGYDDGFIYEVKVNNKDNYMYYYYDAIDGKNIKVITIEK
ncbi:MAG: hypothetical protein WDA21_00330 [Bacilli bacterium]